MLPSSVTAADLAAYVNPDQYAGAPAEPDAFTASCLKRATALVTAYVAGRPVPDEVIDEAILEVGSELYHRRKSPQGVAQFGTLDGGTVFTARDPLVRSYPLLDLYLPRGLA